MQAAEKLLSGSYYHIYNHAVGGRNLFSEADNYDYFLHLYDKYISPIADTYAWALMPNHFHLLVRVRDVGGVATSPIIPPRVQNPRRDNNNNGNKKRSNTPLKIGSPSQQFSKLFNAYAQAYNKRNETRGTLFEHIFRRKRVDDEVYLRRLVLYIHNNPVHHGFCSHPLEYAWTSYLTCTSDRVTHLRRPEVLDWFGGKEGFVAAHLAYNAEVGDFLEL